MKDLVIFPLILSLLIPGLVFICYFNGLLYSHYLAILPLVSDTGNYMPEAALFAISISAVGIFFYIVGTIRDIQLIGIIDSQHFHLIVNREGFANQSPDDISRYREKLRTWINLSNIAGMVVCFSCVMTGAFRMAEVVIPHFTAAGGIFVMTPIYMGLHTYLTHLMMPVVSTYKMFRVRLWITAFNWSMVVTFLISGALSVAQYGLGMFNPVNRLFWDSSKSGFYAHVICCMAEWGLLLSVSPFVFTFCFEFRRFVIRKIQCEYYFYG